AQTQPEDVDETGAPGTDDAGQTQQEEAAETDAEGRTRKTVIITTTIRKEAEIVFTEEIPGDEEAGLGSVERIAEILHLEEVSAQEIPVADEEEEPEAAREENIEEPSASASEDETQDEDAQNGETTDPQDEQILSDEEDQKQDGEEQEEDHRLITLEEEDQDGEDLQDSTEESVPAAMPAVTFDDSIVVQSGSLSSDAENMEPVAKQTTIAVHVEADEGTFPENTTMVLSAVAEDRMETVAAAVEEAVANDENVSNRTRGFHALDISFRDANGKEIEPRKPIRVSMKSDEIRRAVEDKNTAPVVVHVNDPDHADPSEDKSRTESGNAGEDAAENADQTADHTEEEDTADNADNAGPSDGADKSDGPVPAATVIETEEQTGGAAEPDGSGSADSTSADTLTFETDAFSVYAVVYTVDFYWEVDGKVYEFRLPGGGYVSLETLLEVLGVAGKDEQEESDSGENTGGTALNENSGEDAEETPSEGSETVSGGETDENDSANDSARTTAALTLRDVQISENTKEFVADVEKVEFSDPGLVWVGKADADTTVGSLKEDNVLDVQYSAELTPEQIAEINAQTVEAGDWALISMQPFTSEEKLTVTMNDGERFVIRVTDYQISTNVLTVDGKTFKITVTFSDDAEIPAGTKLIANEIESDTEEYLQYLGRTWAEVNKKYLEQQELIRQNPDVLDEIEQIRPVNIDAVRYFNISFVHNGREIEPNAPVRVDIQLVDGLSNSADAPVIGVVHFPNDIEQEKEDPKKEKRDGQTQDKEDPDETKVEFIEGIETVKNDNGSVVEFLYEQEKFSAVGVYIGQETEEFGMTPLDPAVALPKLTALRATGEMPSLAPFEASKTLTPNTKDDQQDGTYTLSLSVKGDAVETNQITKANVLIVMDRSTSMNSEVDGSAIPYTGAYQQGKTYYGIVNGELVTLNYDAFWGWIYTENGIPRVYNDTVYVKSSRLQAEQAALDELIGALVEKNTQEYPDVIEVNVSSFASARGSALAGFTTQNVGNYPVWSSTLATESDWQTGYDENGALYQAVHDMSLNNGTNWEDALLYAKELADAKKMDEPEQDVIIIFMTDGMPTAIHGERSDQNGGWGAFHYINSQGYVSGGGNIVAYEYARDGSAYPDNHGGQHDASVSQNVINNRTVAIPYPARAIVDEGYKFYSIFTFNPTEATSGYLSRLTNFAYGLEDTADNTPTLDAFYTEADNIASLRQSFDNIFTNINDTLSYGDVTVVDGLTTDSMTTVVADGQADGFVYTVRDENDNLFYTVTASGDASDPTVTFNIENVGTYTYDPNLSAEQNVVKKVTVDDVGTYYSVNIGGIGYRMALASTATTGGSSTGGEGGTSGEGGEGGTDGERTLTWDLSPIGALKKDYTYTVECIVWPNQDAYDYVAGLNNGLEEFVWDEEIQAAVYDSSEPPNLLYYKGGVAQYPSIVKDLNGVYSVLTNTDQKVYYSDVHAKGSNDVITSVEKTPHEEELDYPDPMPLTSAETLLEKTWSVDRNPAALAQFLYDSEGNSKEFMIEYGIYRDGSDEEDLYTSMTLGWDGEKYVWDRDSVRYVTYNGHRVPVGMRWTRNFAIAAGLMLSEEEMLDLGLKVGEDSPYDSYQYGEKTYYILETGHDYTVHEIIPEDDESWVTYEFDFAAPVYHPMLVDGVLRSVTFDKVGDVITSIKSISGDDWNVSLNMENVLRGYINLEKRVVDEDGKTALPDDETKFTYEIELYNDSDPGPFVGDDIPWYGINGLFYHTYNETTGEYEYYQAEVTNTENNMSHTLTIETESGEVYEAWCVDNEGVPDPEGRNNEDYIFDEDIPGPTWVEYYNGEGYVQILLYGNQMDCERIQVEVETEGGGTVTQEVDSANRVSATLQISQSQVLNLANIPKGTKYTITESPEEGYHLINIRKEIRNGDTVESRTSLSEVDEETIVPDRDNHIIFTNKVYSTEITVKKFDNSDGTGKPLTGAVFTLTRTDGSGESEYDNGVSLPANGESDLASYKFSGLPDGTYTLEETIPPAGYAGLSVPVTFTVTDGVVNVQTASLPTGVAWDPDSLTFTVKDPESSDTAITVRKQWLDKDGNPDEPGATEIGLTLKRRV
ncbi:MAG: SpaA isopeptide-forming pilin-related protein, partial [Eubacteriales bacterium]|nr:SpaA isopeptide-forming pilin-related protein [Eubacteriales bacterium]